MVNSSRRKIAGVLLAMASLYAGSTADAQIVLQDFSATVGANTYFHQTWELSGAGETINPNANFIQGSGVYDFTGSTGIVPTNNSNSLVEFFYSDAPIDIGTNSLLAVSARILAGNAATSFTITLFDGLGGSAFATFATGAYSSGSYTELVAPLTFLSGFNPAHLDSMWLYGGQPGGTDAFSISFDAISAVNAVPEPGTYAIIAGVVVFAGAIWRRRTARAQGVAAGL